MKKKTEDSCENCRFWLASTGDDTGACRRSPPRIVDAEVAKTLQSEDLISIVHKMWCFTEWPWTFGNQWCGEHERKQ